MFRNFGKVFSFSLHNQTGTKSYKVFTIVFALILLIAPTVIMMLIANSKGEEADDQPLETCGADIIYIVSDLGGKPDLMLLAGSPEENYQKIKYKLADSVDEALEVANMTHTAFVLHFYEEENYIRADIILPENCIIPTEEASNYFQYMDGNSTAYNLLLSGLSQSKIMGLMTGNAYKTYTESGYAKGLTIDEDEKGADELIRDSVLEVFQMLLPYLTIMVLYFLIFSYGNATAQSMVMEKESKLMDTMLISLHPEAMVFGKLLAIICAGLIQIFGWLASIVVGMIAGVKITESAFPGYESPITTFFSFMEELGLFKTENVIIGVCFLVVGFVLYLSLATIAGSISANREEVASQSSLFILPLLASFMLLMMGGGLTANGAPLWMDYVPFTAALIMPSQLALGVVGWTTGLISLAITVALSLVLVIISGKIYKAMSLYKGNKVKLGDVLKLITAKEA